MKNIILKFAIILFTGTLLFTACKKDKEAPVPDEQELITTVNLTLEEGGISQTFTYKVENGFGTTSPGSVRIDTLMLRPGTSYSVSVEVLNEKASPVEDITEEIQEERDEHLFLYLSDPASGAGSVRFSGGNEDGNGLPFNLTGTLTTGEAGDGRLDLYLMHAPANKAGATPDDAGGETDIHASFPVRIRS